MIRRVNFIAGPGVGKSCVAAWNFAMFKFQGQDCELVTETVKSWAYEKRCIKSFDQHYLFANQMKAEDTFLANGAKFILSDSPLYLSAVYGRKGEVPSWETILIEAKEFERVFPSINIFMMRSPEQPYQSLGRFQTKDEAIAMDSEIYQMLHAYGVKMHPMVCYNKLEETMAFIRTHLSP